MRRAFQQCLPFCSHIVWRDDSNGYIRMHLDISQILLRIPDSDRPWLRRGEGGGRSTPDNMWRDRARSHQRKRLGARGGGRGAGCRGGQVNPRPQQARRVHLAALRTSALPPQAALSTLLLPPILPRPRSRATTASNLLERHTQRRCKPSCCKKQNSRNQVLTGFEPAKSGRDPEVTPSESGCLTSH